MSDPPDKLPPFMREAIDAFFARAEEVVNAYLRLIDSRPPPSLIYHYTNDAGLRGILESGKVWLTDIFNLNDPTELKHGVGPAIDILRTAAGRHADLPEVQQFAKNITAMLRGGIEQIAHYFVCCFSHACDDLGQWRAYADDGRGYAIAFDAHALEQAFAKTRSPGNMTFPVTYGTEDLRAMCQAIIDDVVPLISLPRGKNLTVDVINDYMSELSVSLSLPIVRAALFFKHNAYSNEQEYRFLELFMTGPDVPNLKYRSRPYSLVRYREFDWKASAPDSPRKIIIGPAADAIRAYQFAEGCIRAFRPPGIISIERSEIPYRVP